MQIECPRGYFQNNSGQAECTSSPEGFYVDQMGMREPKKCPGSGTNNGVGNQNFWSCFGSDIDGDGVLDEKDAFPHLDGDIDSLGTSLIWLVISSIATTGWANNLRFSSKSIEEEE